MNTVKVKGLQQNLVYILDPTINNNKITKYRQTKHVCKQ